MALKPAIIARATEIYNAEDPSRYYGPAVMPMVLWFTCVALAYEEDGKVGDAAMYAALADAVATCQMQVSPPILP